MWFAFAWMATCVGVVAVAAVAPLFAATKEETDGE